MSRTPLSNGLNGDRGPDGRFRAGNSAARGRSHPHARRVAELRAAMLAKIGPTEVGQVVDALLSAARAGDVQAARTLLQWGLGPAEALDLLQRIDAIEAALNQSEHAR